MPKPTKVIPITRPRRKNVLYKEFPLLTCRRTATHLSFYVGPPLVLRQAAPGSQKLRAAARSRTGQTGKILSFPACLKNSG